MRAARDLQGAVEFAVAAAALSDELASLRRKAADLARRIDHCEARLGELQAGQPVTRSAADRVSMAAILRGVEAASGVRSSLVRARERGRAPVSEARQAVMYLCAAAGHKPGCIGRFLGRDHSTVASGVRAHAARCGLALPGGMG